MKKTRHATRSGSADKRDFETGSNGATADLQPGEFQLEAPSAKSVKLAASFTEWEKNPLAMNKSENGTWLLVLPLPRGSHPYRFIVDGQWWDDPRATLRMPNPFGTENAVKVIA